MPRCDVRTLDTPGLELNPCCNKNPESVVDDLGPLTTSFLDCRALAAGRTTTPTWTRIPFADAREGVLNAGKSTSPSAWDSVLLNPRDTEVT